MRSALVVCLVVGCSGGPAPVKPVPPAPSSASELSPALAPLAWWLGDWEGHPWRNGGKEIIPLGTLA